MKKQLEKLKKFWKLMFGRTGILVFLLLVQAVILFGGFALIDKSAWIVNYTIGLLAVIILIYILNKKQFEFQADVDHTDPGGAGRGSGFLYFHQSTAGHGLYFSSGQCADRRRKGLSDTA